MLTLLTLAAAQASPAVVLVIADGTGSSQLELASHFRHGRASALTVQGLPVHATVYTSSLDGVTDSAAAATALATGIVTRNRRVGVDADGVELETLLDLAHAEGLTTGVVTTTTLPHATPAAFTAHTRDRRNDQRIAQQQLSATVDLMLGGGSASFNSEALSASSNHVVRTTQGLETAVGRHTLPLLGLFAKEHLPWVQQRDSATPGLAQMTRAALDLLSSEERGFFLLVEAGRVDHACHQRDALRAIHETLELDATVQAIQEWDTAGQVTLLVTADHETGGLTILEPGRPGQVSEVDWEWGDHTNAPVPLYATGPGAEALDGRSLHHTDVHAFLRGRISASAPPSPPRLLPDGQLSDLTRVRVAQEAVSHLDSLHAGSTTETLAIGVAGWFRRSGDGIIVLVDVEALEAPGHDFDGPGPLSEALSGLRIAYPDGFRPDLAVGALRARPRPVGLSTRDGSWAGGRWADGAKLDARAVFAEDTRHVERMTLAPPHDRGFEAHIAWDELRAGGLGEGAVVRLWALELRTPPDEVGDYRALGKPVVLSFNALGELVSAQ